KVKVVLLGDRMLYHLLSAYDPEFREYFKVLADFDDEIERNETSEAAYARLLATIARDRGIRPLDRDAVARTIEQSARMADDAEKLSLIVDRISDLLVEADFLAGKDGAPVIGAAHVNAAIEQQIFRLSRVRDRVQ